MKVEPRPLLVMHPDRDFRNRVRDAASRSYYFQDVPGWKALRGSVEEAPPSSLVVVDPYRESDDGLSPALRALLADFPSTSVIVAVEVTPQRIDDLRTLGEWGVTQVVSLRHDDTVAALTHRFRAARGGPLRALLAQVLPPETSGRARGILDVAAEVVASGGHGRDVAEQLGLSRRTLLRWCERAELPPPRTLMAWMRLLLAAEMLDDPGRTVLTVARTCGYSSDSGLRRVMTKFLGMSPGALRKGGAFKAASAEFVKVLAEFRTSE
ncbi:MAG: helix-turn-helix domain-containing protein [Gemmatimonadota bacterium]|jgi:AraC-like DNA-binding protein|nr:helix-turn-helix domain-containing protein [Gemmatimonadota bacterium]